MADTPLEAYKARVEWPEQQPKAVAVNQFAVSFGLPTSSGRPDVIYLSFGHAEPLFALGRTQDDDQESEDVTSIPVDVLGRYVFTRSRLSELIALLEQAARVFDQAVGGEQDGESSDEQA